MRPQTALFTSIFAAAAMLVNPAAWSAEADFSDIQAQIARQHDEGVKRLQDWIRLPSIAAQDLGYPEGADYMVRLLQEAGFQEAVKIETDGKPGVFATLDAGAPRTVGVYFMYDVKHFDPQEWSSPPLEAAIVDKPGLGKVIMGRGAVNQKGPEAAFLAALHAIRGAGRNMPVNVVLVAEGEEEIGSPNIAQIVDRPEVRSALAGTVGVFIPSASQDRDGLVTVNLGRQGRHRGPAGLERRDMGTRPGQGRSLFAQGDDRQPVLAPGARAEHAGLRGRQHDHHRELSTAAAAQRGTQGHDCGRGESTRMKRN